MRETENQHLGRLPGGGSRRNVGEAPDGRAVPGGSRVWGQRLHNSEPFEEDPEFLV